jgi:hypothetical protein
VIPDQDLVAAGPDEGAHAVMAAAQDAVVVEGDRGAVRIVERAVAEALRQVEPDLVVAQVTNRQQRTEVDRIVRGGRSGDEAGEWSSREGSGAARGGRTLEEGSTIHHGHGWTPPPGATTGRSGGVGVGMVRL